MNKTTKKCLGCGILLQYDDPNKPGYAVSENNDYCQDCFRLKNYGVAKTHTHPQQLPDFANQSAVILVVSVLFLDTLFTQPLNRLCPNGLSILINKVDLLPPYIKIGPLLVNLRKRLKQEKINFLDIIVMSAKNPDDISPLAQYIRTLGKKDVYLIGNQNSGKTTIFKALTNNDAALSHKKAALTQEILVGKLGDINIYDTPGLYTKGYLHDLLPFEKYKDILPEKQIKPVVFNMKKDLAIIADGLIGLELIKNPEQSITCFFADGIKIHKTKGEKVDQLLNGENDLFKCRFAGYVKKEFKLTNNCKYQITFADFGFIQVKGPSSIRVWMPHLLHISVLETLIK